MVRPKRNKKTFGESTEKWGQLLARCHSRGITLPAIDSQLAATAKHHSLVIATRNRDDFSNAGIKSVNPFEVT